MTDDILLSLAAVLVAMAGLLFYLGYRTKQRLEPLQREQADTEGPGSTLTRRPASPPYPSVTIEDEAVRAASACTSVSSARAAIVILIYADSCSMASSTVPRRFGNMVEELSTTAIMAGLFGDVERSAAAHLYAKLAPEQEV